MHHLRLVHSATPLGFGRLEEVRNLVARLHALADAGDVPEAAIDDIRAAAAELLALRAVVLVGMAAE